MKYIKVPTGEIFNLNDCEILIDYTNDSDIQKELAKELFLQTGILVAETKGGENDG